MTSPKKLIAAVTGFCFLFTSILSPALEAAVSPRPTTVPAPETTASAPLIPAHLGSITAEKNLDPRRTVILIQDMHCQGEVQKNISAIIGALDKKYSLDHVYVEGASGVVDTSWVAGIPAVKVQRVVAVNLMETGRLTGAEHYAITAGKTRFLRGLEDEKEHTANIIRLGAIMDRQKEFSATLTQLDDDMAALRGRYLGRKNRKLIALVDAYRSREISARKYYTLLIKFAQQVNDRPADYNALFSIRMTRYPTLTTYVGLLDSERRLQYSRIRRQLPALLAELRAAMPVSAFSALVKTTGNLGDGELLYGMVDDLARENNIDLARRYPDLARFLDYRRAANSVNPLELIREERRLVEELRIACARDVNEADITFLCDFYDIFKDYVSNRLSADDYEYFTSRFGAFQSLWSKYNYTNHLTDIATAFPLLNDYYRVNDARSQRFVENILRDDDRLSVSVMVAGGFHSAEVQKLLEQRGISYRTITPKVGSETGGAGTIYRDIVSAQSRAFSHNALSYRLFTQMDPQVLPTSDGFAVRFKTGEYIEVSRDGKTISMKSIQPPVGAAEDSGWVKLSDAVRYGALRAQSMALEQLGSFRTMLSGPDVMSLTALMYFLARKGWLESEGLTFEADQSAPDVMSAALVFLAKTIDKKSADLNDLARLPGFVQNAILTRVERMQGLDRSTPAFVRAVDDLYSALITLNSRLEYTATRDRKQFAAAHPAVRPRTVDSFWIRLLSLASPLPRLNIALHDWWNKRFWGTSRMLSFSGGWDDWNGGYGETDYVNTPEPANWRVLSTYLDQWLHEKIVGLPHIDSGKKFELSRMMQYEFIKDVESDFAAIDNTVEKYAGKINALYGAGVETDAMSSNTIKAALIRLVVWGLNAGLINPEHLVLPSMPELTSGRLTIAITETNQQYGLGDFTKMEILVRGLIPELQARGITDYRIRLLVFEHNRERMEALSSSLMSELGSQGQDVLEIQYMAGKKPASKHVNDVDVLLALNGAVSTVIDVPSHGAPEKIPLCYILTEYDYYSPKNRDDWTTVEGGIRTIGTGFNNDRFFINPDVVALYESLQSMKPADRGARREETLLNALAEITLQEQIQRFKTEYQSQHNIPPTGQIVAEKTASLQKSVRDHILRTYGDKIREATASSQWGTFYMHEKGSAYIEELIQHRLNTDNTDSTTIFTFFSTDGRASKDVNELSLLKGVTESRATHLYPSEPPIEFYDLAAHPEQITDIDFNTRAIRVVNLGMRALETNTAFMAFSDLPVGVTGDESLLTAITLGVPFVYEVYSWKEALFKRMREKLMQFDPTGAAAAACDTSTFNLAIRSYVKNHSIFDDAPAIRSAFRSLGDSVRQKGLPKPLLASVLHHRDLLAYLKSIELGYAPTDEITSTGGSPHGTRPGNQQSAVNGFSALGVNITGKFFRELGLELDAPSAAVAETIMGLFTGQTEEAQPAPAVSDDARDLKEQLARALQQQGLPAKAGAVSVVVTNGGNNYLMVEDKVSGIPASLQRASDGSYTLYIHAEFLNALYSADRKMSQKTAERKFASRPGWLINKFVEEEIAELAGIEDLMQNQRLPLAEAYLRYHEHGTSSGPAHNPLIVRIAEQAGEVVIKRAADAKRENEPGELARLVAQLRDGDVRPQAIRRIPEILSRLGPASVQQIENSIDVLVGIAGSPRASASVRGEAFAVLKDIAQRFPVQDNVIDGLCDVLQKAPAESGQEIFKAMGELMAERLPSRATLHRAVAALARAIQQPGTPQSRQGMLVLLALAESRDLPLEVRDALLGHFMPLFEDRLMDTGNRIIAARVLGALGTHDSALHQRLVDSLSSESDNRVREALGSALKMSTGAFLNVIYPHLADDISWLGGQLASGSFFKRLPFGFATSVFGAEDALAELLNGMRRMSSDALNSITDGWHALTGVRITYPLAPGDRSTMKAQGYDLNYPIVVRGAAADVRGEGNGLNLSIADTVELVSTGGSGSREIREKLRQRFTLRQALLAANETAMAFMGRRIDEGTMTRGDARKLVVLARQMADNYIGMDPAAEKALAARFTALSDNLGMDDWAVDSDARPLTAREQSLVTAPPVHGATLETLASLHQMINYLHQSGLSVFDKAADTVNEHEGATMMVGKNPLIAVHIGDIPLAHNGLVRNRLLKAVLRGMARTSSVFTFTDDETGAPIDYKPLQVVFGESVISCSHQIGQYHTLDYSAELAEPDRGGYLRISYTDSGLFGLFRTGARKRLQFIKYVLEQAGMHVTIDDMHLAAILDKDSGAMNAAQIEYGVFLITRLVWFTRELDQAFNEKQLDPEEVGRMFFAEEELPFSLNQAVSENRIAAYRGAAGQREELRATLNEELSRLGLTPIPLNQQFGQRLINAFYNDGIRDALVRGEVVRLSDGTLTRSSSYDPAADMLELARDSRARRSAAKVGSVISRMVDQPVFEPVGSIGGLICGRAQQELDGGIWLVITALIDPETGRVLFARCFSKKDDTDTAQVLKASALTDLLAEEQIPLLAKSSSVLDSQARGEYLMRTVPAVAGVAGTVQSAEVVSAGAHPLTAGIVTFARDSAQARGKIFMAPFTAPDDIDLIAGAAAVVTTGGGALSHAAITTREAGVPGLIVQGASWVRDSNGRLCLRVETASPIMPSLTDDGYWFSRHVVSRTIDIHEGDVVLVDTRRGGLSVFDPGAQALLRPLIAAGEDNGRIAAVIDEAARGLSAGTLTAGAAAEVAEYILTQILYDEGIDAQTRSEAASRIFLSEVFERDTVMRDRLRQFREKVSWSAQSAAEEYGRLIDEARTGGLIAATVARLDELYEQMEHFSSLAGMMNPVAEQAQSFRRRAEQRRAQLYEAARTAVAGIDRAFAEEDRASVRRAIRQAVNNGMSPSDENLQTLTRRELQLRELRTARIAAERRLVYGLDEVGDDFVAVVGGKSAKLGEVAGIVRDNGGTVPDGLAVTTAAFETYLREHGLTEYFTRLVAELESLLKRKDLRPIEQTQAVETMAREIRDMLSKKIQPDGEVGRAILSAIDDRELGTGLCAVRSSGVQEDTETAAFAGVAETYLYVQREDVLDKVRECWQSFWLPRGILYRAQHGVPQTFVNPAVTVQTMVDADASGILFTADPVTGADDAVITAAYGLGEGVVGGQVDPDRYQISWQTGRIRLERVGSKAGKVVKNTAGDGTVYVPLSDDARRQRILQSQPALKARQIRKLTAIGAALEEYFGYPLDIEFSVSEGQLYILQVRPITGVGKNSAYSAAMPSKDTGSSAGHSTLFSGLGLNVKRFFRYAAIGLDATAASFAAAIISLFSGEGDTDIVTAADTSDAAVEALDHAQDLALRFQQYPGLPVGSRVEVKVSRSNSVFVKHGNRICGMPAFLQAEPGAVTLYIHQEFINALYAEHQRMTQTLKQSLPRGGLVEQFVGEEVDELFEIQKLTTTKNLSPIQAYLQHHRRTAGQPPAHHPLLTALAQQTGVKVLGSDETYEASVLRPYIHIPGEKTAELTRESFVPHYFADEMAQQLMRDWSELFSEAQFIFVEDAPVGGFTIKHHEAKIIDGTIFEVPGKARLQRKVTTTITLAKNTSFVDMLSLVSALYDDMYNSSQGKGDEYRALLEKKNIEIERTAKHFIYAADYLDKVSNRLKHTRYVHAGEFSAYLDTVIAGFRTLTSGYKIHTQDAPEKQKAIAESWLGVDEGNISSFGSIPHGAALIRLRRRWAENINFEIARPVRLLEFAIMEMGGRKLDDIPGNAGSASTLVDEISFDYNAKTRGKNLSDQQRAGLLLALVQSKVSLYFDASLDSSRDSIADAHVQKIADLLGVNPIVLAQFNEIAVTPSMDARHMICAMKSWLCGRILQQRGMVVYWADVQERSNGTQEGHSALLVRMPDHSYSIIDAASPSGSGPIPVNYIKPGEIEQEISESAVISKILDTNTRALHHIVRITDFENGALSASNSNFSIVLRNLSKFPRYRATVKKVLNANSRHVGILIDLGIYFLELKQYTTSEDAFLKAIKINPNIDAAWFGLGRALFRQGRYADASKALVKAAEVNLNGVYFKQILGLLQTCENLLAGMQNHASTDSPSLGEPSVPTQVTNLQPHNEILLYPGGKFRGVAPNSGNEDIDHFLFKLFNDQSVIEDRTVDEIETAYQEIKQRMVHNYGLSASGQDLFDGIENMLRALFPRENASFVHDLFNRVKNTQGIFKATDIDPVNLRHVRILEAGDFEVILLVEDKRVAGTDKRRVLKVPRPSPLGKQVINKEVSNVRDLRGTQGLVTIYEIYEHPAILMEYVDGDTLDAYYKKHRAVPDAIREVLHEYARDVAASGYGISDIHGANIIRANDGAVKVIDIAIYDKHRRAHGSELAEYNINKIDEMFNRFTQMKGPETILPATLPENVGPVSPMTLESSRVVEHLLRGIGAWFMLPPGIKEGVRVFDERVSAPLLELPRFVSLLVLSLTDPEKYAIGVRNFFDEHGYTSDTHYNYFKIGMADILEKGKIYNIFNFPVPTPGTIAQLVARHSRYNKDARRDYPANPPVMLLPGKGVQPAVPVKSAENRDSRTPAATAPEIALVPYMDTKYIEVAPFTRHEEIDHFLYRLFKSSLVPYALNHLSGFNVEDAYYTVRKNMLSNIENGRNPFDGIDETIREIFNPNDSMQGALESARKTAIRYRVQVLQKGSGSVKSSQNDEFTFPFFINTDESGILADKIKEGIDVAEIDEFIASKIVPVNELHAVLQDVNEAQKTGHSKYIKVEDIDENLRYERILSSGKYGIIIVVVDRRDNTEKILKIPNVHPLSERKMRAEIAILKDLKGTPGLVHIIQFYDNPAILMEYVRGASLFEHIAVNRQDIPESLIQDMLAFGKAVAKRGYFLKDLHSGNIMINEQGKAIFIDVGEYQQTGDVLVVVERINESRINASYSSTLSPGADATAAAILQKNAGPHLLLVGRLQRFMPLRWAKVIGLAIVHAKEYALLKPLTDELASVEAEHHAAVYDEKHGIENAARRSAILAMGETGRQACCNFPWLGVSRAARFIVSGIAHIKYDLAASLPMAFIVSETGVGLEDARHQAVKNGLVPVIVRSLPDKLTGKAPRSAGIKNVWARMEGDTLVMYIKAPDKDTFRRMVADVVSTVRGYAHMRGAALPVRILSDESRRKLDGEKIVVYDEAGAGLSLDGWQDVPVLSVSGQWGAWEAMANEHHADTVARAPEMGLELAWSEKLGDSLLQKDVRLNQSLFFTVGTIEDLLPLTTKDEAGMTPVQLLQSRGAKVYVIYHGTSKTIAQSLIIDDMHGFDGIVCTAPALKTSAVADGARHGKVIAGADAHAERAFVTLNLASMSSEKELAAVTPGSVVRVHLGKDTPVERITALKALPSSAIVVFEESEFLLNGVPRDTTGLSVAGINLLDVLRFTPRSREELVNHQRKVADELTIDTFEKYDTAAEAEREFRTLVSGNFNAVTKNKMFIEAVRLHARRVDDKGLRKEFLTAVLARLRALQVLAEAGKSGGLEDRRLERVLAEMIPLAHDAAPDPTVMDRFDGWKGTVIAAQFSNQLFIEITAMRRQALKKSDPQAARTVIELIKLYAQERKQLSISAKDTVLTGTAAAKAILEAA